MRTFVGKIRQVVAAGLLLLTAAWGAQAQDLFDPVMIVNDRAITRYEVNQRVLFFQLLRQPGDLSKIALETLIDERLQLAVVASLGAKLSPEDVKRGMTEFAARANLTPEQFIEALGQGGVEPQAFRDFVEAGMAWRELVRAKFGPTTKITENEIDRAIANGAVAGGPVRVQLSEILLPTNSGVPGGDAMALAQRLRAEIKTETGFADAARRYSKAESGPRGGRLDWQLLDALPSGAGARIRAMKVGTVSEPIAVPGAIMLYFLRDIGQEAGDAPTTKTVDYAQFLVPEDGNTAAALARLRAETDTCDDLYATAKGLPADRLLRDTLPEAQVPGDIAQALAGLDTNESSTTLRRGGWRVFLMLCSRVPTTEVPPSREDVRSLLTNQRLTAQAELYMTELRAEAIIRTP